MRFPLVAVCLFAVGCTPVSAPLVIGHVANFTGPDKDNAEQALNGIKLAVEDFAAQKPARRIAVLHADDKGSADAAEGQAVRLVAVNHAGVLLGGDDAAEASLVDRAGSLLLSPIGLRTKSMSDVAFVTGLSPTQRGKALAKSLIDLKSKAPILLVEPSDDATAAEAAFVAAWKEAKLPALPRQEFGDAASDTVKEWAQALAKDKLPIVFASPAALKTLALGPLSDRPLAYAGPEVARQPLKDRAEPIYLVTALGGDKAAEFAKRYEAKFQTPAEPHAAIAFDDARLAIELLKKGTHAPQRLRDDALALKEFPGLTGPLKIADGSVERPAFAGRLEKGSFVDAGK